MPKLCEFKSAIDSKPVFVNAAQTCVVYTYKGGTSETIISFGKDFNLGVSESLEEVVRVLNNALVVEAPEG
ncbi:hypothetical protein DWF00_00665 [Bosea caraganae]|uniref:Uncharacterized protein n=1 Tax=Bosea caraganae TaxID=2763117 RepID=A0A370L8X0_9HYPH|nr:hypothetical protein [Bosea caraganae]RDJ26725.1 hypothetical protein DWE98_07680 [Bosea caraganae]RDJ30612.1 hypothetical protein DWF00_00665 [Bosea caraganae]